MKRQLLIKLSVFKIKILWILSLLPNWCPGTRSSETLGELLKFLKPEFLFSKTDVEKRMQNNNSQDFLNCYCYCFYRGENIINELFD